MLSIIVPTYNESDNVARLISRIDESIGSVVDYEIVFVDDSTDDTPEILKLISDKHSNIKYIHREISTGLGTAVVDGFALAHGDVLTVMDADLQHPPELLLQMLKGVESGADIVIPSRFIAGGDDGGLRFHRKVISGVARYLGKIALKKLRKISDPTSGYFLFRRDVISEVTLNPIGWKILIEILAKGNYQSVVELPYEFQNRKYGTSKMSLKQQWNYIKHLASLMISSEEDRRFYIFAMVGLSGMILNLVLYDLLFKAGVMPILASFLATLSAIINNFIWNDRITWKNNGYGKTYVRALKYILTSSMGALITVSIFDLFYNGFHVDHILAQFLGVCVSMVWNYLISKRWTWKAVVKQTVEIIRWDMEATD